MIRRAAASIALASSLLVGCGGEMVPAVPSTVGSASMPSGSLVEARRGFVTKLIDKPIPADPIPEPPAGVFRLVRYDSQAGKLAALLTPDPGDGRKHPAIVWITGGDCNSIGELWEDKPRDNDQTAAAYRKAGIAMMFPSLRGGNQNPGKREGFLGEVDDVIAAADFLSHQPYVDPARIYLGGHSTGGTLAMLVAESTDRFRAVIAFGPVDDVKGYGGDFVYGDPSDPREFLLRSPGPWLGSVRKPLFVLEGTDQPGNLESLQAMAKASRNPLIRFVPVAGVNHFSILAPVNAVIAAKIVRDDGPTSNLSITAEELNTAGK